MGLQNRLFDVVFKTNVWERWRAAQPRVLTVLNYHRIYPEDGHQAFFRSNISATPSQFSEQLDYLKTRFNVISTQRLVAHFQGENPLPPNAALITFDDGYYDNFRYAYPELKRRDLPAIIFLATGYIGKEKPFYWDLISYGLGTTSVDHLSHPAVGEISWDEASDLNKISGLVVEKLKLLPEAEKVKAVDQILAKLDVTISEGQFFGLMLDWDQVKEMSENGIEMGAHTVNHPILTRISIDDAKSEIQESIARVRAATGKAVEAFAYPNGQSGDFNSGIQEILAQNRCQVGLTLLPGPHAYRHLKRDRFAVRRIFLSRKDALPKFAAKIHGAPKISRRFG